MRFVDLASNATLNYAKAQAEEQKNMNEIDSFLQSNINKIENNKEGPKVSLSVSTSTETTVSVIATVTEAENGITSYKFEYKLSTDTEWTLGKENKTSNETCEYTYTGLTSGKRYNLRVTVTDRAGNTGTGEVTTRVKGVVEITEDEIGMLVNYKPDFNTYPAETIAKYNGAPELAKDITTDQFSEWTILGLDKTGTNVLIFPSTTSAVLTLCGENGTFNRSNSCDKSRESVLYIC